MLRSNIVSKIKIHPQFYLFPRENIVGTLPCPGSPGMLSREDKQNLKFITIYCPVVTDLVTDSREAPNRKSLCKLNYTSEFSIW